MLLRGLKIQTPGVHKAFYYNYHHHNGNTRQNHEELHKIKEVVKTLRELKKFDIDLLV